ncbi:MAG TPA: hypothetical protein DDW94_03465 [Deltaproteobacteria bacterium]|nr:MAG: hypothetical protein A2Z79_10160 [Deltaproteobacteria bacterium GWA2_55_82]OGQ63000.1 MAG: hypothetical protein A3I81_06810 [Deltaproteobacteria bacterium RIFCSPLOWO2_02_FULL_55_12]OIJ72964.1 MAG: hypothetical protein A2V21_301045 [Deltaproteobacteria bacterium GWC2_55_46]HBG46027.1 hypothetical protein [Deltaproteobacteria bacterium]HCY11755.1 hypothetical protein [Deltaproteobacteria bacterium]
MIRALLLLVFLLLPADLPAQGDAVTTAINIVENFNKEATILMNSSGFTGPSQAAVQKAAAVLKEIRITEPPGPKRHASVFEAVSSYTGNVLESIEVLKNKTAGRKKDLLADKIKRLEKLRTDDLARLSAALYAEAPMEKKPKEVPSIDLSPFDEEPAQPDGPPGILYR